MLKKTESEIYIPDGTEVKKALERTTHMAISAHQDDIEIMAYDGIVQCFGKNEQWFTGIVVTNGSGSPRDDLYASYTDEEMQKVRRIEQKKAAYVGEYGAQILMQYSSREVKEHNSDLIEDLKNIFRAAKPRFIYTHNLADKHDTHVAVTLRTIQALREISGEWKPEKVYGCEVWRDLDWVPDEQKVVFDVSAHENLAVALMGVFDSQVCGGKRYDLAIMGRRRAHATFFETHAIDNCTAISYAMDLTPLIDKSLDVKTYIQEYINRFSQAVADKIERFR